MQPLRFILLPFICALMQACQPATSNKEKPEISFNRDIRPILTEHCTGCHGGVSKQAGVSFVYQKEAYGRGHSGRLTIKPGDPAGSELIARIETQDENLRMPYNAPPLAKEKIAKLRQWIREGAKWETHWAFKAPQKPPLPLAVAQQLNPIDQFVQQRLKSNAFSISPRADKYRQLRRLSLDLTGLPPSLDEIRQFIHDNSDDAYEKQVDRLLASEQFGERWAAMWLDLARYADSQGYTRDEYRASWPYRDWVIKAFNQNMPYNDFITKQLAGDLLDDKSVDDLIATSFHRQTPINSEGGTDDEEFRVIAVMDRVATSWRAINGITMECVQCHSHPYDPIEHDEYYKSYAFFNTSLDADYRSDAPHLMLPKETQLRQTAFELQMKMQTIRDTTINTTHQLSKQTGDWLKLAIVSASHDQKTALEDLIAKTEQQIKNLDPQKQKPRLNHAKYALKRYQQTLQSLLENQYKPEKLHIKNDELHHTDDFAQKTQISLDSEKVPPDQVIGAITAIKLTALPVNAQKAIHTPEFAVSIDDIEIYKHHANGTLEKLQIKDYFTLHGEALDEQLKRLAKNANIDAAGGLFSHRLFAPLSTVAVLHTPLRLKPDDNLKIVLKQYQLRNLNEGMPSELQRFKVEITADEIWHHYADSEERTNLIAEYQTLSQKLADISSIALPVMLEQDPYNQRGTALFSRGNFLAKQGPLLKPHTPALLPPMPVQSKANRLTLAKWFFRDDQPLTARVAVNHFWQQLFGRGLVDTIGDFGSAGELPSHPKLLDWLAVTFQQDYQWDIKKLLKLMVMSETYRQTSASHAEQANLDPQNRLLSRANTRRLSAEMVRDQALFVSGLLTQKLAGEPVMPPQPQGIWGRKGRIIRDWQEAQGENRYRRAIYTFIKRAYIYPSFLTFDMETREISHGKRIQTNTPLQALVTLNDPVYVEASEALGKLIAQDYVSSNQLDEALKNAFLRVTSQPPTSQALTQLKQTFANIQSESDQQTAFNQISALLLNLDAALTR
ncbi:PSD1 and planctomycete cytochrome C domain-containing protein [Catenovulum sediminis]|uniref:PSD1 and planctomycete cytochrome C domain-containing protein n=1 Tax=Catenovulum sediminis TaxID=1740262 RepID=UPI0011814D38|nr:PSD1 and planctomycete cytochrome C domain-containing protein [Catenovulum sediminis]